MKTTALFRIISIVAVALFVLSYFTTHSVRIVIFGMIILLYGIPLWINAVKDPKGSAYSMGRAGLWIRTPHLLLAVLHTVGVVIIWIFIIKKLILQDPNIDFNLP